MKEVEVKVGQRYATKNPNNGHAKFIMQVTKVENGNDADGYVHWRTEEYHYGKKNQKGRVWWFREHCVLIS